MIQTGFGVSKVLVFLPEPWGFGALATGTLLVFFEGSFRLFSVSTTWGLQKEAYRRLSQLALGFRISGYDTPSRTSGLSLHLGFRVARLQDVGYPVRTLCVGGRL